jgi:5'-nucleotidase/UDP-sugar diphosphatase
MRRLGIAGAALLLWSAALATLASAQTAKVTFVVLSDIYEMGEAIQPDGKARGGMARVAAIVKSERAKGGAVIVAHAGDMLSPSLMSGIDRGAHMMALTNMIAPDILVPGNHEFDFGKAVFLERMGEARFPLFAANLRMPDGKPVPGFKDRSIMTVNGVRIGLTGTTLETTPRVSASEDLRFLPVIPTIKSEAEALRKEGADLVVAVVHSARGEDYAINATGAADIILSGHDHDLFVNYDERSAVVESPSDARHVVVVDVAIDVKQKEGKRTVVWSPLFRIIDSASVKPDAKVAAKVKGYQAVLAQQLDQPIGTTAIELDSRNTTVRAKEAALGNLFADALRAFAGAEVALMNGGSFRGGKVYPAGSKLTKRDILAEFPFNNRVVTARLSGRDLKRALENGLSAMPNPAGRFLQVSGISFEAQLSRPAGQRVTSLTIAGEPVDDARLYLVATNDFLARGGDGYDMIRDAEHLLKADDSPLIANAVIDYIRKAGSVSPSIGGRIVVKP